MICELESIYRHGYGWDLFFEPGNRIARSYVDLSSYVVKGKLKQFDYDCIHEPSFVIIVSSCSIDLGELIIAAEEFRQSYWFCFLAATYEFEFRFMTKESATMFRMKL